MSHSSKTLLYAPDISNYRIATGWDSLYSRLVVEKSQRKDSGPREDARLAIARALQTNSSYPGVSTTNEDKVVRSVLPRVLVIDDEDFIRELYRDVFEAKGM